MVGRKEGEEVRIITTQTSWKTIQNKSDENHEKKKKGKKEQELMRREKCAAQHTRQEDL